MARGAEKLREAQHELAGQVAQPDQRVHALPGDVSDPASCAEIVRQAQVPLPNLTVLVNNAGAYWADGPTEEVGWTSGSRRSRSTCSALCPCAAPRYRRARGYGKIVNLSGGGATAPLPRISAYAASKAAVVRLTETFAEELRDAHIDVNAIAPGALNTRLLDEVLAAGPAKVGQDFYDRAVKQHDQGGAPLEKGAALAVFRLGRERRH
ncbi:MAG: SDR family NAD(P)-dependent oxidoreductase [Kouleothrix sp.]